MFEQLGHFLDWVWLVGEVLVRYLQHELNEAYQFQVKFDVLVNAIRLILDFIDLLDHVFVVFPNLKLATVCQFKVTEELENHLEVHLWRSFELAAKALLLVDRPFGVHLEQDLVELQTRVDRLHVGVLLVGGGPSDVVKLDLLKVRLVVQADI